MVELLLGSPFKVVRLRDKAEKEGDIRLFGQCLVKSNLKDRSKSLLKKV